MASDSWFYAKDGQQLGPVTTAAVQQMLSSGQISGQDLVWQEGMADWQPAGSVPAISANTGYGVAPNQPPQSGGYPPQQGYAPPPQGYAPPPQGYGQQPLGYQANVPQGASPHQSKATTAFVLSLVGLVCFGIILGIVSIVMGTGALNGMKASGDDRGKGLAIAAIVIGIVDIIGFFGFLAMRFS